MPKQTYRKLDLAHDYLAAAAEHYFAERYFPAIALAAMAEEIFDDVMRSRNAQPPRAAIGGLRFVPDRYKPVSEDLIEVARMANPVLRNAKEAEIYRLLYRVKNSAKHGTLKGRRKFNLTIECDPELEAWSMLGRAVENMIRLHFEPQGVVMQFYKVYQAPRKTEHHEGASIGPYAKPYTIPTQKPWKSGEGD